jgi:hypothetical protein
MASRIVNQAEWPGHLLHRLRRQVALTSDAELATLSDELRGYSDSAGVDRAEHIAVVVLLRLRHEAGELAFFSMVATCGTPSDITVAELVIESFFPADGFTASILRSARPRFVASLAEAIIPGGLKRIAK